MCMYSACRFIFLYFSAAVQCTNNLNLNVRRKGPAPISPRLLLFFSLASSPFVVTFCAHSEGGLSLGHLASFHFTVLTPTKLIKLQKSVFLSYNSEGL